MSALLRGLLVLSATTLLVVGCGSKEEAAPAEAVAPVAEAPAPKAAEPGGYEPTAEERVPGITIDPATLAAQAEAAATPVAEAAAEAAPAEEAK